ncbi:MAG: ERF family protein [Pseudonocardiaceae bacterium]
MPSLTERAKAAATGAKSTPEAPPAPRIPDVPAELVKHELGDGDPEMVPVHVAWLRVRRDVKSIGKTSEYKAKNKQGNDYTQYKFRGVDDVINSFGPVTLVHGVHVFPVRTDAAYRDINSSGGSKMRECTVTVTWLVMGPMGDTLPSMQSCGEAMDSSDKGTAKAQSVALRVLLLTGGLVPTNSADPDSQHVDRGEAPVRSAASYLDEIIDPSTSFGRIRQIHHELKTTRQLGALVTNETAEQEPIGDLVVRIGRERKEQEGDS